MHKRFINFLIIFILIQPIFDISIYFLNRVIGIETLLTSIIRPLIAAFIYIYLLFNHKVSSKAKAISFIYLSIYGIFCLLHLVNISDKFFELSVGTLTTEVRYLFNYGYFLLQLINFYLIFKIASEKEKSKILKAFVFAILIMAILYFISIFTGTSPRTYIYSTKDGFRGWSVSAHYIGHSIIYALPVIIYALFEKQYIKKYYKYLIFTLIIIPPFYLIGTKAPLFATFGIIIFYTLMLIIVGIKNKKLNFTTIYFSIISLILICTFTKTYGFDNFQNQVSISYGDETGIEMPDDSVIDKNKDKYEENIIIEQQTPKFEISYFEDRVLYTLYKYRDIKTSVFDNRIIQKTINKEIYRLSPISDKILGYGHDTLPKGIWVETDFHTIYYCYGIMGLILILIIPFLCLALIGLKCLINIKNMNKKKFILGFGLGLSMGVLYIVGYTLQFSQTAFYMIILLTLGACVFQEKTAKFQKQKDYLFAINDLNVGGAEVGMVDVVNELISQGKSVDIVLLRKEGPLLERVNNQVHIYEILNKNYSPLKRKLYHVLYMLGGNFAKYVYKKTIPCTYKNEIAYLEGYPAVFIAASSNPNSIKIASIRVGLKNHKLKAAKLPWGELRVKQAYKKMDNIYTVSDLTTEEFLEKYPFCKSKTTTIYTYFNIEDIKEKSSQNCKYKFPKDKVNFLTVGRFSTQKSYDRLIEAFSVISKKYNNVLLHFLGNDNTEEGEKIKELIKEKRLENKIIIHGVDSNPYPYIKSCDVLISSSLYEGFPRVINEALALEKLCIGTNVTGTNEALHNGKLGILVDNSVSGLIEGIEKYLTNPNIYQEYKEEILKFDGNRKSFFEGLENISRRRKEMIIYMPKLSVGGMEKALINLINYAKLNDKYKLTLYLVYKGEKNYLDMLPKNINLIVASSGKWNILGKIKATIRLLARYIYQMFKEYDIAISYSYQHPILTTLTRLSSENSIVYIHSNLISGSTEKIAKKRIKKCKYEKFKKIICVSYDAKNTLTKLISREKNIYVVNNIIDGDRILAKSAEKVDDFKFDKNKIYFINICRHFESYKRLLRIVEATKRLNQEGYQFEVLFIGDGEDHNLYVEKIKEYNISNIHLLGQKENPYKYLKRSSALLLSSIREGYPVVFIEAMVLNKPIITTAVSDALIDIKDKFGIVVDNDDQSIYNGMREYIEHGFKIKNKFNYLKFNEEILKEIDNIYNK